MVVVVILGILATVTVFIISAVFNANIQAGQKLGQQTTIQTASGFFNKHLSAAESDSVGMVNGAGTAINRVSIAGDQFTAVSDDYCYRVFYLHLARALEVSVQAVDSGSGKCKAASNGGIAPTAGPTEIGGSLASDPVLSNLDLSTGAVTGELPDGAQVFALAHNVRKLTDGLAPFTFSNGGATALLVDAQANSTNSGNAPFYSNTANLQQVGSLEVSVNVQGAAQGPGVSVSDELFQNTFYIGGSDGSSSPAIGSGERLASRAATVAPLTGNTLTGNTLTANGVGVLTTVDGVSLSPGDRVLVKNEAAASKNGLYEVTQTGTDTIPGTPAGSGEVIDYGPSLYWAQMGTNLTDSSGYGHDGAWGGGTGSACPSGSTGSSIQSVTGATGSGGWGGVSTNWGGTSYPTYTSDSPVNYVAVHAGIITGGQTANVKVCQMPSISSFPGSAKNGVTTSTWGSSFTSIIIVSASGGAGPAGGSATGFDAWNSPGHNATDLNSTQFMTSTYNDLWNANGGSASIVMGFRSTTTGSAKSLFSSDGLFASSYRGIDAYITSGGDVTLALFRDSSNVPLESATWSVSLDGSKLTNWVNKWVGAAFVFTNSATDVTLYLKDLSAASNPWVSQGTKSLPSYGQYLDCDSLGVPCSTWPGSLVVGARSNASAAVDQKFSGRISQFSAFEESFDIENINLFSEGTPAGPETPGTPWVMTRVAELDSSDEVTPSQLITVAEGTAGADTIWQLTTNAPITLNTTALDFDRKDGLSQSASEGLVPVGSVIATARSTPPPGYLMANGQVVSRTSHADLFAAIGTIYNIGGESSSQFRVPDLRGRVPVGADSGAGRITISGALGNSGGAELLTAAQLPSHNHTFSGATSNAGAHSHSITAGVDEGWWSWTNNAQCGNVSGGTSNAAPGPHNHGVSLPVPCNANWSFNGATDNGVGTTSVGDHSHSFSGTTASSGTGSSVSIKQPYQVLNYLIKY